MIWNHLQQHPVGRVFTAPFDVAFSDVDVVEPDLLYISGERLTDVLTPHHVRGAPDLVIEIGSESTRKRDETLKARVGTSDRGVQEYWVVDPEIDVVRVYRRSDDMFARPAELSSERAMCWPRRCSRSRTSADPHLSRISVARG
jgi:Uma2 family endonuclease